MRNKDVFTTGQVAKLCRVAPRTVTKWFDTGQLGGYRIPGSKDRRIPLSELIRFMKEHDIPTNSIEKGRLRILVIDSRTEYTCQFTEELQSKGSFEVKCAHNSFDAGLMALKFSPNIILIDLMSNDIDAVSLCSYVTESDEIQDCALIALAGGLGTNEVENLQRQGFHAVVTDPDDMNGILNCIHESLQVIG